MSARASGGAARANATRDKGVARAIERWFAANVRPFPWRPDEPGAARDPWVSLVSEFMLQQTQASRVAERLPGFLSKFPTPAALARATEDRALAAWSGLGYYRRARLLRECAIDIVARFDGRVPEGLEDLRSLPGVGAYTAGAIASIVFGAREALADANVSRVALRLEGKALRAADGPAQELVWGRARALVRVATSPALLNEGLMELGAVVCTARAPRCEACPVARWCEARRLGLQDEIPAPKASAKRRTVHHAAVVVRDGARSMVVRRGRSAGGAGLWAGCWQPPTLEREDRAARADEVAAWLGVERVRRVERFRHTLSHRVVVFTVWEAAGAARAPGAVFKTRAEIGRLGLATPHARILLGDAGEERR